MLLHSKDQDLKEERTRDNTVTDLWLGKNTGQLILQITDYPEEKSLTLVRLDSFYIIAEVILEIGFSEDLLPYAYASSREGDNQGVTTPFRTNVFAITDHFRWPMTVADRMTEMAQKMVGYFTGKDVRVKQMGGIKTTERGEVDLTTEVSNVDWTPPFEVADECVFCLKMTDESVMDRVAGFQWALDKEVAGRFGAGLGKATTTPKHYEHDDTHEQRQEYHDQLVAFYAEHPLLFGVIPLIDLPLELKRTLCIQWNHIVRDHLKADPRFIYREEDGMYFWMAVRHDTDDVTKRLIPEEKTRSNTSGSAEIDENMIIGPMMMGGYGAYFY